VAQGCVVLVVRATWYDVRRVTATASLAVAGELELESAWYCEQFGHRQRTPVIRWTATVPLPAVCGWRIDWPEPSGTITLQANTSDTVTLDWTENQTKVELMAFEAGRGS
jgi:hypothetical protein